jgi:hypothetical protein
MTPDPTSTHAHRARPIAALSVATLLVSLLAAAPVFGEGPKAALLLTKVKNVDNIKLERFWPATQEIIGQYYTLIPEEQVMAAQKKAEADGCVDEACAEAVRKELGVPVALQLYHVDEGYFNPLKMWKATEAGIEKHDYMCSRCTFPEFKVIVNRLTKKFEADH